MDLNHSTKPKKPVVNIIKRIIICILVLSIGVLGMAKLASLKKPPVEVTSNERPIHVKVLNAEVEDVPVYITGYGEVKALNVVSISPEIAGKISEIHPRLEIGEIVQKSEILFKIETSNYMAAYKEARAMVEQWENAVYRMKKQYAIDTHRLKTIERNRDLAGAEFERIQRLFKSDNVGTMSGVDRAEQAFNTASDRADQMAQAVSLYPIRIKEAGGSLESAKARLSLTNANLERCEVLAPFDGRIKNVSLEKGQYVGPGQNVVTLADDSILEIHVPLDSRDARQWLKFKNQKENGRTAWFSELEPLTCYIRWTEMKNGNSWKGRLHRVVKFDPQTRTLTVAIRVKSEDAWLSNPEALPLVEGMFCSVRIPGRLMKDVIRLPRQAVSFTNTVYISNDSRLKTIPVKVLRSEGDYAFISEGLRPGDLVIATRLVDPLENALLEIKNIASEKDEL